jgi:cellulose synthase/poly-beta-1,6-N-acetylglucosamine synthase-like glycosyltransferase
LEKWQGLEWSLGYGYIVGLDQLGLKSTAVGNNMCFTREAYEATGGYQIMPFSVTEDFQLFQAIKQNGYKTLNLIEPESLNISSAQTKLKSLLHQRKRWMIGAQDLPWYWIIIFGLQAVFYPCLFWLLMVHSDLALDIWLIKILLQSFYLLLIHIRLKRPLHFLSFVLFEPYSLLMQLMMLLFYFWPVSMVWKDRKY